MERLDRVVDNRQWLDSVGNSGVKVLISSSSDHYSLLFSFLGPDNVFQLRKIFKYEAKWALEEDGEQAIRLAWQHKNSSSNCWVNIHSKLKAYNNELIKWNAPKKRLSKKDLNDKMGLLKQLQDYSNPDMNAIRNLEGEVDKWLKQEDIK